MKSWALMGITTACFTLTLACDQQTEVQRQTHELQEAQKNVGKVAKEIESQLADARADVARLENKLELARQGLTDDVLENQRELTQALRAQEDKVRSELGEAKREAQIHSRDTEAALKQLGQASATAEPPPPVDPAQPAQAPLEGPDHDDLVPVKGGPDPRADGDFDIEPGTPEPQAPPAAVTPNDPPAPTPAPPAATYIPPSDVPAGDTPPSDTPPSDTPPSNPPAPSAAPPSPNAPAPTAPAPR
jgi:TolA-binding protein